MQAVGWILDYSQFLYTRVAISSNLRMSPMLTPKLMMAPEVELQLAGRMLGDRASSRTS